MFAWLNPPDLMQINGGFDGSASANGDTDEIYNLLFLKTIYRVS